MNWAGSARLGPEKYVPYDNEADKVHPVYKEIKILGLQSAQSAAYPIIKI